MTAADSPAPYTLRSVQQILGLSRAVLAGLIAGGFVSPQRGPRNALRFSFRDLMLMRTAHALQQAHIAPRKILRALARLQTRLPDQLPLTGLRLTAVGAEVVVRDRQGPWLADSGQCLMDFEVAHVDGEVTLLLPADAVPAGKRPPPAAVQSARIPRPAQAAQADAAHAAHTAHTAPRGPAARPARPPRTGTAPAPPLPVQPGSPPDDADAQTWFRRGERAEPDDLAAAEAAYRRAIARAPGHVPSCLNLGALLCEAGRCDEAVALYRQALAGGALHPLLDFNHAVALEDLGRTDDALASYERALAQDPALADAHFNAARLLQARGNARAALRHLNAYRRLQRGRGG